MPARPLSRLLQQPVRSGQRGRPGAWLVANRTLVGLPVPQRKPIIDYLGTLLMIIGLTSLLLGITHVGQGHSWRRAGGGAQNALRAELLLTFQNVLMVSAAISLLGLAAAIAMPNTRIKSADTPRLITPGASRNESWLKAGRAIAAANSGSALEGY